MNIHGCYAVRLGALSTMMVVLALSSIMGHAGMKAATCVTNPVVISNADSGMGSLRQAILDACDGSTITFADSIVSPITLSTEELNIDKSLTILGPGADKLIISGNNLVRLFRIGNFNPDIDVGLSGLTLADGHTTGDASSGAAILSFAGTRDRGGLVIDNCSFSDNQAAGLGGSGGAIFGEGSLTVTGSTFINNSAPFGGGGGGAIGIAPFTAGTAINCTFSGNSGTNGGAISIFITGVMSLVNCTLSGNSATSGGGVQVVGKLKLTNTIIAGSTGEDCVVLANIGSIRTNIHNLIQDGSCSPMLSGDPKLGPLQNNGGPTQTFALLPDSPAIDAGKDSVLRRPLKLTTDQRGPRFPRKSGEHVDIGAFEFQFF
jgi:predicted outer membrane repeat protein